jgi:hypothetical protein
VAPPRLYGLTAARVPVVLVFARGPASWWALRRWDLASGELGAATWFHGTLYPRRCDLSPDGRYLYYFALKAVRGEWLGQRGVATYSVVSRAPWLTALAAWGEAGTWTRGYHFVERAAGAAPSLRAEVGDLAQLRGYDLALTPVVQYAAERRRGWIEHEASPPRAPGDVWDERRHAVLVKDRPRGKGRLVLHDRGWATSGGVEGRSPRYELERGGLREPLDDAAWADWDAAGRLLVATRAGRLEIRRVHRDGVEVEQAHDLDGIRPDPRPAPPEAAQW